MKATAPTLLRLPQVMAQTGLTRSGVYELIATNDFPRQIPLSARCVAWVESEVQAWIAGWIGC